MGVPGFRGERNLHDDLSLRSDFEQSRLRAQLGDQRMAVGESLGRADLGIVRRLAVLKNHFPLARQFLDDIAPGNQHIAAWEHVAVPSRRASGIPRFLALFINDAGERRAGDEEGMTDGRFGVRIRAAAGQQNRENKGGHGESSQRACKHFRTGKATGLRTRRSPGRRSR